MVNLLTPILKRLNRLSYVYRLGTLFLIIIVVAMISGLVVDVGRWGAVMISQKSFSNVAPLSKDEAARRQILDQARLSNRHASALASLAQNQASPSGLVEKIIALRPVGLKINRLAYQAGQGGDMLSIVGVSQNRLQIVDFANALELLSGVASVDSPLENLLRETNPAFTINLKMKPLSKL